MRIKKTYVIAAAAVLLVIVGAVSFSTMGAAGAEKKDSVVTKNQVSVKAVEAKMKTIAADASFNASLESSKEGTVSNKVGGKVIEILFENGQVVSQGQALVKLDDTDIKNNVRTSEAQLAASQSQLNSSQISLQKVQLNFENTQRNYNRTKTLYEQQIISKSELENAELALKSAQVDLETSKAAIASQRAGLQSAKTNLSILNESLKNTTVTAPISGVISGKNINLGQFINVGTVLGKVGVVSPIYAEISVNETDFDYIKLGTKAKLTLNNDSTVYDGTVENIDGVADPASRSFACKIKFDNQNGKLKPGVFGKIGIAANANKKAIALPVQALGGSQGEYYVFINNNGTARKQTVSTGEILKDTVEITSGVKEGDSVICSNVGTLQDGDAVKVVTE